MPQNFLSCEREQVLLMPPSLRDWLPEDHLVWFILATVEELDLGAFYTSYRADGHGRAAHDPAMVLALLLYAYARGQRSSRGIERSCVEDIAFRVIAANQVPDHATIARFRQRHENAIAELFGSVLGLCARAGMVKVGVIAIDGTKMQANASQHATRDYARIARQILGEADEIDREEDALHGRERGDELPPELATREGRQQWLRSAKRDLDEQRAVEARPIPRSRQQRLVEAKRRLEEELAVECAANKAYEHYRAHGRQKNGRRLWPPPKPYTPPDTPTGKINLTDLDSRNVKTRGGYLQGYNAQAAVTAGQIVIAAEISVSSPDFGLLGPVMDAALGELAAVGVTDTPDVLVADTGYWHQVQMDQIIERGIQVLIPPDAGNRKTPRPGWDGGLYAFMRRVLATQLGGDLYRKRKGMIEPVFANTKFNRGIDRFQRRGRSAVRSEWRLITATHNLMKLHTHQLATAAP
jgi:transposase